MSIQRAVSMTLLAASFTFAQLGLAAADGQARAMWVVRYSLLSAESIDRMVQRAADAGFDNLFVQVCGRGDAWFPSRVYPQSEPIRGLLATGFDPLAYVLEKAHARGIRVHAWVNTLLVWSAPSPPADPSHAYNRHPDWMMYDSDSRSLADYSPARLNKHNIAGAFLSPADPGVRAYLEDFIRDMVSRYPLDGVHLDYIRYPMSSVDYGPEARRGFHSTAGIDPLKLVRQPDTVKKKYGKERFEELMDQWRAVRAGYVSGIVARVKTVVESQRPGTVLSAAVKPDIEDAYTVFGQDWPSWVREGYVRMVLPMAYSTDPELVHAQIEAACREIGAGHVWAGLRAWDVPVSGIMERARKIVPLNAGGICFFSYDGVQDNRYFFDAVRRLLFKR
ncbi:MAG: family 10 glycosylhydrolase [Candidatus Glassbacteria bacterium]|nr:family 10 glycosylhydrolase [Candidatus Glassbacteria bacterium]